jgi:hypothetical protein
MDLLNENTQYRIQEPEYRSILEPNISELTNTLKKQSGVSNLGFEQQRRS